MARHRYSIHMTYADGTPGLAFCRTRAEAFAAAQAPTHGGRPVAVAEVCERLSNGAETTIRTFRLSA